MQTPKGILVDLDGTVLGSGRLLPGAGAFLRAASGRCIVVSNDAEHLPAEIARKLCRLGVVLPPDRILLAGALALERLAAQRPGVRVLVLASRSLRRYAQYLGLRSSREGVDVVFLGRDRRFGYETLALAANAVRRGALLVVANPDLTHPSPDGGIVPETGALLRALLACTGPVPYEIVGKPEPHLFQAALERLGLRAPQVLMIGDNPETDGRGARDLGIPFVQVSPEYPLGPEILNTAPVWTAEASA